jgi:hypothetical protein
MVPAVPGWSDAMPDLPVEPSGPSRYPADMESRVAVLEQIARTTTEGLAQIVRGMEGLRAEFRTQQDQLERRMDMFAAKQAALAADLRSVAADQRALAAEHRADFRWLLGVMLAGFTTLLGAFGAMLGVMAHGFHWL